MSFVEIFFGMIRKILEINCDDEWKLEQFKRSYSCSRNDKTNRSFNLI